MNQLKETPRIRFNVWMARNDLNLSKIARKYGCVVSNVRDLVAGLKSSKKLVDYLIGLGCPADCFDGGRIAGSSDKGGSNGNV